LAVNRLSSWLASGNGIAIPRVVAYEFRRGVHAGSLAPAVGRRGELFLASFVLVELSAQAWDLAAQIWGELYRSGNSPRRRDGDILIAATALVANYELVTRNERDFHAIKNLRPGLKLTPWT
jgi:predicted nucleic acid-binding protein